MAKTKITVEAVDPKKGMDSVELGNAMKAHCSTGPARVIRVRAGWGGQLQAITFEMEEPVDS